MSGLVSWLRIGSLVIGASHRGSPSRRVGVTGQARPTLIAREGTASLATLHIRPGANESGTVMSSRRRRAVILALAAALAGGFAGAGQAPAALAAPSPGETADAAASPSPDADRAPLTPEQVKAQVAQAAKLQSELAAADKQIAAATAQLSALATRSNAAMSAVSAARSAEATARKREQAQLTRLTQLTMELAAARRDVSNMAYDAYVNGSSALRDMAAVVELTQGHQDAAIVEYLASNRAAESRRYATLAAAQKKTARAATAARRDREAATTKAEAAQRQVQHALTAQQKALTDLQKLAGSRRAQLDGLGADAAGISGVDLSALQTMVTKPLCTQDSGAFANGMFPASALCPISGLPGHMMRPAAARALAAMSEAYRKDFGRPLCVTDTYRSYAAQVDVKARKPTLAATPGTSNHGLGLATDLCGGIESFGTAQHRWMQQHAPLFGFYHPAWAQAGGSKPEPWHWEFAQ